MANQIESLVEDITKKQIRESLKDMKRDRDKDEVEEITREDELVQDMFSRIPENEGYYIKIYLRHPVPREYAGRPIFLHEIQQAETVQDIESTLLGIAKELGWKDGLYEVRLIKRDSPGYKEIRQISLQVPTTSITNSLSNNPSSPASTLDHISSVAKLIKEIGTLGGNSNGNPDAIQTQVSKLLLDAFNAGANSNKQVPAQGQLAQTPLPELMKALKDFAPVPVTTQPQFNTERLVSAIGELVKSNRPTESDPMAMLLRMKELGLFPNAQPVQDTSERVLTMVTTLLPLINAGGGGDGKTSIGIELVRALAPKLPEMVQNVTQTINTIVKTKSGQGVQVNPKGQGLTEYNDQNPLVKQIEQDKIQSVSSLTPLGIFAKRIETAVSTGDKSVYNQITHALGYAMNDAYLQQIVQGSVNEDNIISSLDVIPEFNFIDSIKGREYIREYITWYKGVNQLNTQDTQNIATCSVCNEVCSLDIPLADIPENERDCENEVNGVKCTGTLV